MTESALKSPSRIYFPAGLGAPFGEYNLMRVDQKRMNGSPFLGDNLHVAKSIAKEAWLLSGWLAEAVFDDAEAQVVPESLAIFLDSIEDEVFDAAYTSKKDAWFALRPPTIDEIPFLAAPTAGLQPSGVYPSQVTGFATAREDVSGNWGQRVIKRWRHPEKLYAKVSDIDVRKSEQSKRLGAALLHASLSGFDEQKIPTLYVAAKNKALIESLGRLSYRPTGSRPRSNLVVGAQIDEVRLQGESVGTVRAELERALVWLKEAIILDTIVDSKR